MCKDELDLEQLLVDPLVRQMMLSDAVEASEVRALARLAGVRRRAAEQRWRAKGAASDTPPSG